MTAEFESRELSFETARQGQAVPLPGSDPRFLQLDLDTELLAGEHQRAGQGVRHWFGPPTGVEAIDALVPMAQRLDQAEIVVVAAVGAQEEAAVVGMDPEDLPGEIAEAADPAAARDGPVVSGWHSSAPRSADWAARRRAGRWSRRGTPRKSGSGHPWPTRWLPGDGHRRLDREVRAA